MNFGEGRKSVSVFQANVDHGEIPGAFVELRGEFGERSGFAEEDVPAFLGQDLLQALAQQKAVVNNEYGRHQLSFVEPRHSHPSPGRA